MKDEEEKIENKFLSDIEQIFQIKGMKIRKKIEEISNQRKILIENIKKGGNANEQTL